MVYNTAIIGCGRIGSLFDADRKRKIISSHCGAYTNHPKTKLISACDINLKKVLQCKNQWNIKSHYVDYREMLHNEKIDILSICTHIDSHEQIINTAVEYGIKSIFCEKPISGSLKSAKKIVAQCEKHEIKLAVNHFRRWDDFFINLKMDIEKGNFGKIQHANFYYTRGIANSGSHLFDLLRFLFGEIVSIYAHQSISELENDPTLSCILEMEDGLICNLVGLDGRNYRIFDLEIFGANSKILIDTSKNVRYSSSQPSKRSSEFNELYDDVYSFSIKQESQIFISSLSNIIESIEGKTNVKCTGVDGYKSLELIIAAKLSYELKQKVNLPLNSEYYDYSI